MNKARVVGCRGHYEVYEDGTVINAATGNVLKPQATGQKRKQYPAVFCLENWTGNLERLRYIS